MRRFAFSDFCCVRISIRRFTAHARRCPEWTRKAFSVGFGFFFLLMIAFTLVYAEPLARAIGKPGIAIPGEAATAIALHMIGQIGFTTAIHARQPTERLRFIAASFLVALVVIFIGYNIYGFTMLASDEIVYRIFMGFYGLIFPAYVWLCLIPGRGRMKPTRRQMIVFTSAVLIALPMFWMGFIERQMIWLIPGVAVVLLAQSV